ncbi:MAG: endonuclease III domain-containing protein [Thiohalomonadales bacterium]
MDIVLKVYNTLFDTYGDQQWWPAKAPFEVMVGAILTQNTAWSNVELAIQNLLAADCMTPEKLLLLESELLADMLRPSGYYNVKARRLINFCRWYQGNGGFECLQGWDTDTLRTGLLAVNGIGPETADDILLYAFRREIFVVDTYTGRLFFRLGQTSEKMDYALLQAYFHDRLEKDETLFNQYHALIVKHAKDICQIKPRCLDCCLSSICKFNLSTQY